MARVCVVRQYYYPLDIRVRREVEALLGAGHRVDLVCERSPGDPLLECSGGLTVWRLPIRHGRHGGAVGYVLRYGVFLVLAGALVAALHLRRRFHLVQVHSLPDTLVLVGLFPRLLGARVLLDLHEVMPEFFATKFDLPLRHPLVRLISVAEQVSIRLANRALTCTEEMRQTFLARGAPPEKITVVLNSADEALFDRQRREEHGDGDTFTLICHGSIEERYGLDLVVTAVAKLRAEVPGLRLQVYGDGEFRPELEHLVETLGCGDIVRLSEGFVPLDELLDALAQADAGVVAMRKDAFRDLTHCNKMYEYLALGMPVVSSRTRSVCAYFPENTLQYFTAGDADDLARAIRELHEDPHLREALVDTSSQILAAYRWPRQREVYQAVVNDLLAEAA